MWVVGVTGGIGSGKSVATDRFAHWGINIVDADVVSRNVVKIGTPALQEIASHFGKHILLTDQSLNRPKLRTCIFNDPEEKQWLEALLHPLIAEEITREINASQSPYVIFVSPLLIESQQMSACDHLLVIDVPEELQIKRTTERDNNEESLVRRIIASQASRQLRLEKANDIIENTGELNALNQHVDKLHQKYLTMASEQATK